MKIVIVSGGTGGHIYPGIAIAQGLIAREPESKVLFIGSEEGLEKGLIAKSGFPIKLIKSRALLRKFSYKAVSAPFISMIGFFQALFYLARERPNVLISTGGYASLPVVLAAKGLAIPIFIHEQNVLPGVTNRLFARWAKKVFLSFDRSKEYLPQGIVTGNPVRSGIFASDREKSRLRLGCRPGDKLVLVVGGSQGARSINQAVINSLPKIKEGIKIVHIIGSRDFSLIKRGEYPFYKPVEYMYNIADAIAAADLAVSRAGATAIAEFLIRELPMILVPFPFSAEGHQELNARVVADSGAGLLVNNSDLTPERFADLVNGQSLDLKKMKEACRELARPTAVQEIINGIRS